MGSHDIAERLSDAERAARYTKSIRRLAEFLPNGADNTRKRRYFESLVRMKRHPDDVDKAVDRLIIAATDSNAFPPFGALNDRLATIGRERAELERPRVDLDSNEAVDLEALRAYRAKVFPRGPATKLDPFPNVKRIADLTPRPTPQPVGAVPPMTPGEIRLARSLDDAWAGRSSVTSERRNSGVKSTRAKPNDVPEF
jgi:hypothetical protein